jgi:hypothetical protein
MPGRQTEQSRQRAREATRKRIEQALDELNLSLAFGAHITQDERYWLFFTALERIEDYDHLPKNQRITEPRINTATAITDSLAKVLE